LLPRAYEKCEDGTLEAGFEKIVIYAKGAEPTHAARQLAKGTTPEKWTSKLGAEIDVEHDTPATLVEGTPFQDIYGLPVRFLRRKI
jgi:hypothetical protein